uniref:Uncharacterized protein n=1 Tax=Chelonoidis abingdonii TaxID=106734 RepID=A0A8C0JAJ1_CHEAB
ARRGRECSRTDCDSPPGAPRGLRGTGAVSNSPAKESEAAFRCPEVLPRSSALGARRSVHVVAFGNERDGFSEDNQQSGLIWTYLGRSALISETESNLLLNSANHTGNPVFTEYQACVFGNVRLVVHDCPLWNQNVNSEDGGITVTEQQWQLILLSPISC